MKGFEVIVIGASAGGLSALKKILRGLDSKLSTPIVIVQHISSDVGDSILKLLKKNSGIECSEPIDKEKIEDNHIYLAPPDYHLLIEQGFYFSIYMGPKENYSRPSIDLLFETAAENSPGNVLGILLTGANSDGTKGLGVIKELGGVTIAQDPAEAEIPIMPESSINAGVVDYILSLDEIVDFINKA